MKPEAISPVKSADRTFDILEYVADAAEPPSFSLLLADLGIPRSSLFHLLRNLLVRGYLEQDVDTERYRLGERVRMLAERLDGAPLAAVVQPYLRQLSGELNETSGFYVRVGDSVEAIASATSGQALAYTMKVGERAPLYAVSSGKITLAHLRPEELAAFLKRVSFDAITQRTLRSRQRLRDEVTAAQRDAFAYSYEEFTPGIVGIATAVVHDGRFFGALNLAIPTARFTTEREATFRRHLRAVAASLAQKLLSQKLA
jgi:IclR family transcriptional regulator, acetate operon repressor